MSKTAADLLGKKSRRERVVVLTCYDFPTARIEDGAGIDVILVGDSVGTNVLGYSSVTEVTMEDMLHHVRAVARGTAEAFLLADMPYRSYETPPSAVENARRFVAAGAGGVKLEGGREVLDAVRAIRGAGIEVCGHLGFTPQSGGPRARVVGRTVAEARSLLADARALAAAGVFMLVLELVPEEVGRAIAEGVAPVVIGIGSGRHVDGEVQVVNDILGVAERAFRHARQFGRWREAAREAIGAYAAAVREGRFPEAENASHLPDDVREALAAELAAFRRPPE